MRTRVGYAGGAHADPTYHDLGDHAEAFQLDFDPAQIRYEELLALFWASHQPARPAYRSQYMAAVFPGSPAQRELADASRARLATEKRIVVETPVIEGARFYRAEDYHQKYYLRHDATLMRELEDLAPRAFIDSPVAARLNGYVAGHGSLAQLDAERARLALSPTGADYLDKLVRSKARRRG